MAKNSFMREVLQGLAGNTGAVARLARERDDLQARVTAAEAKVLAVYELLPIGVRGTHDELFAALAEIRTALTGKANQ